MAANHGAFTGTAAALGTLQGVLGRDVTFKYVTSGAETVSVTGSVSGTVISSKLMAFSILTGALHSSADMAAGTYVIRDCPVDTLIFLGSGASDTKTVTFVAF